MKLWKDIRVWMPSLFAVFSVSMFVLLLLDASLFGSLRALYFGATIGYLITVAHNGVAEVQAERAMVLMQGRLPRRIDRMGNDSDGNEIAAVTRANGDVIQVTLPAGYSPLRDGPERLLMETNPEMFDEDILNHFRMELEVDDDVEG